MSTHLDQSISQLMYLLFEFDYKIFETHRTQILINNVDNAYDLL